MHTVEDSIHIRPADAGDCTAIKAVALASYAIYLERMHAKPFPMLDDYAVHIQHNRVHVLESAKTLCGYVVLMTKDADSLLLDNIGVLPEYQGRGYGHRLALFAEQWAKEQGYSHICLYTNEVMTENLGWYQRLGYGVTHKAVENGYRRIYMVKDL